ncbi:hypothetical protein [Bacillus sp. JJ722]|uniref:hypothetical protein n=1 Tax=Bacillus sp. JJ722 TaxID=3122973 RepID=UPI002FFF4319
MEENQTEVVEQVEEVETVEEETPDVDALQRELAETKAAMQRQTVEHDFYKRGVAQGVGNIDQVMPYIDFSKVSNEEGVDTIGDILTALTSAVPQKKVQRQLGEPTNGGSQHVDKTPDMILKQAEEKARRTGKTEDRAAFSALKQKLYGGNK